MHAPLIAASCLTVSEPHKLRKTLIKCQATPEPRCSRPRGHPTSRRSPWDAWWHKAARIMARRAIWRQ
ncbi:hypothetical protein CN176_05195 [Sinorhizobium medicae]|nr:hypothetical protein CN176_05195 [Sinorhizobium medicae]